MDIFVTIVFQRNLNFILVGFLLIKPQVKVFLFLLKTKFRIC